MFRAILLIVLSVTISAVASAWLLLKKDVESGIQEPKLKFLKMVSYSLLKKKLCSVFALKLK